MSRSLQAAGNQFSGRPDYRHPPTGGGASGKGRLVVHRNCTQSFTQQSIAPLDLFPCQQILHSHPVALFRSRRILSGNPFVSEQLQIVLCRRYPDIEAGRHLSPRSGAVLCQESNNGHPGQVPERVNGGLQMSCGLRVGIPGHICNLAAPARVFAS